MIENVTPNYHDGMTRRPIGHKPEPDGPDPETPIATFLYREDARAAIDRMFPPDKGDRYGYRWDIQYVGAWMRWAVLASRKSWTYRRWVNKDGTLGDRW
jgi:hypothetical protein